MKNKGQSTVTGISDQADIALLYLLAASEKSDFEKIVIEPAGRSDFTLIYKDIVEDYEIKSFAKPLRLSDIKNIIAKKLRKQYGVEDRFFIVVRRLSERARNVYLYLKNYAYLFKEGLLSQNPRIKTLVKQNWTPQEISFLLRTEIIEFNNIEAIHARISEHFTFKYHFYYDDKDKDNIIAQYFKEIMNTGKSGGAISNNEFKSKLLEFEQYLSNIPTPFDPKIKMGNEVIALKSYLDCPNNFRELDNHVYLSQLSAKPQLIFYLSDKLKSSNFTIEEMSFFLEKMLIKECYIHFAIRIIREKWKNGLASPSYVMKFLINNYRRFSSEFEYDDAMDMLEEVVSKDAKGEYDSLIIGFLKKEILRPFDWKYRNSRARQKKNWQEDEHIAQIMQALLGRASNVGEFIAFLFKYYDFTSDDFENVVETPPLIYKFVRNYICSNLKINFKNFKYVVGKISAQFNAIYGGGFKGYERAGGGRLQVGNTYSISDKGVVRLLFKPLFLEMYEGNKANSWLFFKRNILLKRISRNNPVFLYRALIPIVMERISDNTLSAAKREDAFLALKDIVQIIKGLPQTSEMVFYLLSQGELNQYGLNRIIELIKLDASKYEPGYPTSLFAIHVLVKLIKIGYEPAKEYFLSLIKRKDFARYDNHNFDSFELLIKEQIPGTDPGFIVDIFNTIDFAKYLNESNSDIVWDKSGIITGLIEKDWAEGAVRGEKIVHCLLSKEAPSEQVLDFLAAPIRELSKIDPVKTYAMISPYLKNKDVFWSKFKNSTHIRMNIVIMGEELVKNKYYNEGKNIVDLCIDDPDPDTDKQDRYNQHIKIKNGESIPTISGVRAHVAWLLKYFVLTNDPSMMAYAYEKIKILMDLDGVLAKKLEYSEPDLYIRKEALVPFLDLSDYWRRGKLNEYRAGLGDEIKLYALNLLRQINDQFEAKLSKPYDLIEYLIHVFSFIRDLSVDDATAVLSIFERRGAAKAAFLFIYYAEFVEDDQKFNSKPFKDKLRVLCSSESPFKGQLAWEFWNLAQNDQQKSTDDFLRVEPYFEHMVNIYDKEAYEHIYRVIEVEIASPSKYAKYKNMFMKAFKIEIDSHIKNKQNAQLWGAEEDVFQIILGQSLDDFLSVFSFLLKMISDATKKGILVNCYYMNELVKAYKAINPKTEMQRGLCKEIQRLLEELYPTVELG